MLRPNKSKVNILRQNKTLGKHLVVSGTFKHEKNYLSRIKNSINERSTSSKNIQVMKHTLIFTKFRTGYHDFLITYPGYKRHLKFSYLTRKRKNWKNHFSGKIFLSVFPKNRQKNAIFSGSRSRTRLIFGHKKSKLKKYIWCQPPPLSGMKLAPNNVTSKTPNNTKSQTATPTTENLEKHLCFHTFQAS